MLLSSSSICIGDNENTAVMRTKVHPMIFLNKLIFIYKICITKETNCKCYSLFWVNAHHQNFELNLDIKNRYL